MGKKVLIVATVVKTHVVQFHIPVMTMLRENGWTVDVAARNDYENPDDCIIPSCDNYFDIPFERNPFSFGNLKAYRKLKKIIDSGDYDAIHCHTPVGGVLGRLAARKARKKGTKVIYTAHGFHFYKGAPLKNWILYYPVEKICGRMTDILITINQEDYERALKHIRAKNVTYVHGGGGGVSIRRINMTPSEKIVFREGLGLSKDDYILLNVGELIDRKNQVTAIKTISQIDDPKVKLLICGEGISRPKLEEEIKENNLGDRVKLLGYRKDVAELCSIADAFIFPSFQEGLSAAIIEAMIYGLPCILSKIRGNVDLIDEKGGILCEGNNVNTYTMAVKKLMNDKNLSKSMGEHNKVKIENFSSKVVIEEMKDLYSTI